MPIKTTVYEEPTYLFDEKIGDYPLEASNIYDIVIDRARTGILEPAYSRENGLLFTGNSIYWLKQLKTDSIDLIFADPPYNIQKADWDKFESQEQYIRWSLGWISEASRILKPTGTLYICGFSENLADLKYPAMKFFSECKWLIWYYRNKANLGKDWGRSHESILHLRKSKQFTMNTDDIRVPYSDHTLKYPEHPQAETSQYGNGKKNTQLWRPHPLGAKPKDVIEIPTTCNGMGEKTDHPTQKPEELLRKIILASSNQGDIVLDPFSGSGTTLVVAEQLGRKWIGCEMSEEYNKWAIYRIDTVAHRTVAQWIEYDKLNAKRRESIR
ncbi:MAG: site-specific DNA-methyltransferase [Chitinispirillales bacterium]|jgi:site-specific DNA-methyltransferase (adenine-specific)|nr:site-specific DNA-methyltransferase [Chitinispirillales bacterium]